MGDQGRRDSGFTEHDAAAARAAAAGDFVPCPRCGELSAFRDGGELVCLDCTVVRVSPPAPNNG